VRISLLVVMVRCCDCVMKVGWFCETEECTVFQTQNTVCVTSMCQFGFVFPLLLSHSLACILCNILFSHTQRLLSRWMLTHTSTLYHEHTLYVQRTARST